MNNPYPIKFEKRKAEQYLTISCRITNPEEIKEIQNSLWNELNGTFENVKPIDNIEGLYPKDKKNLEDFMVYKYPLDRIHFSLFVILTKAIPDYLEFEKMANLLEKDDSFKKAKEEIIKIMEEISSSGDFLKNGQVKRIYFPQKIENSIALNIYTKDFQYLKNLEEKIKNRLKKHSLEGEIKLKIYNEEYFAINLIRFIHKDKDFCLKGNNHVYEKIKEINKKLEKDPITLNFEIKATISDPYLSNKDPFLK
jgi:uncharacterized protein YaaR (DUF327 family)